MTAMRGEEAAALAMVQAGDEAGSTAQSERCRRQLHVHCYGVGGV